MASQEVALAHHVGGRKLGRMCVGILRWRVLAVNYE
jgi:hypothetical protein